MVTRRKRVEQNRLRRERKRAGNAKRRKQREFETRIATLAHREDVLVAARLLGVEPYMYAHALDRSGGNHAEAAKAVGTYWILDGKSDIGVSTRLAY